MTTAAVDWGRPGMARTLRFECQSVSGGAIEVTYRLKSSLTLVSVPLRQCHSHVAAARIASSGAPRVSVIRIHVLLRLDFARTGEGSAAGSAGEGDPEKLSALHMA